MPVHTWAYIYSRCPECGRRNRILVTFPKWNGPFKTRTFVCECGATLNVSDPHKYDADGNIIDERR